MQTADLAYNNNIRCFLGRGWTTILFGVVRVLRIVVCNERTTQTVQQNTNCATTTVNSAEDTPRLWRSVDNKHRAAYYVGSWAEICAALVDYYWLFILLYILRTLRMFIWLFHLHRYTYMTVYTVCCWVVRILQVCFGMRWWWWWLFRLGLAYLLQFTFGCTYIWTYIISISTLNFL